MKIKDLLKVNKKNYKNYCIPQDIVKVEKKNKWNIVDRCF